MKKQKILNLFVICGLLFVIGFAVVLFRMFVVKKRANATILIKNQELEQANEEIRVQRDVVTNQKDHIEHIHEELTSSIVYAKRIQQAVLPMEVYLDEILKDYFILSKPKDIVSGDFFWITKVNTWTLFCVADCTGHGVPGAFMSMLGIALLNEIVRQEEIITASQALDQLRKRVIESLQQKGISGEQQDGMDIAFCALNMETLEMHFAGANNPCWIVNSQKSTVGSLQSVIDGSQAIVTLSEVEGLSYQIIELKPDKMPIGIHERKGAFTNKTYQLQKGDLIYLMSDGYEDQYGGSNQRKFYSKNLKQLLLTNSQLPLADQKRILEKTLLDWMIGFEQIDDITIFGMRV
jgi:serine phosphatase RsbU (regulator of sigma subunit)